MKSAVSSKADMYRRSVAGEFGNTLPRFFTIREWWAASPRPGFLWGVQHTAIAGFPGTRLNVPTEDVTILVTDHGFGADYVISPMLHQYGRVQWEGDVCSRWDGPGLICSGSLKPAPGSWRRHMLAPRLWEGTAATILLRYVLNDNSYDDVQSLIEDYPDHVVELSALDCCVGTKEHRNAVIWEVRKY